MSTLITFASIDSQTAAAWCAAWGTWFAALGTIVVAVAAFFPELVRGLILRPKFVLECGMSDALYHGLVTESGSFWRQIRLRVRNNGNTSALDVEVHLLSVSKLNGSKFETVAGFVPARLKWTHGGPIAKPYLAPETSAFLDFGSLGGLPGDSDFNGPARLSLNAEVEGLTLWDYEGGTYHFDLGVSSSTGFLKRMIFEVSFEQIWNTVAVRDANFRIKPIKVLGL